MTIKQLTNQFSKTTFGLTAHVRSLSMYKVGTLCHDFIAKIVSPLLDLIPVGSSIRNVGTNSGYIPYGLGNKTVRLSLVMPVQGGVSMHSKQWR